jgi:hypothetical protein
MEGAEMSQFNHTPPANEKSPHQPLTLITDSLPCIENTDHAKAKLSALILKALKINTDDPEEYDQVTKFFETLCIISMPEYGQNTEERLRAEYPDMNIPKAQQIGDELKAAFAQYKNLNFDRRKRRHKKKRPKLGSQAPRMRAPHSSEEKRNAGFGSE